VRSVDAHGIDKLCADAVNSLGKAFLELVGHHTRSDRDTSEILHGVRLHSQALGAVLTSRCPQNEMESVLSVQSQARDLCAQLVLGNGACLVAIAVKAEAS
jgi:hypothetical protein